MVRTPQLPAEHWDAGKLNEGRNELDHSSASGMPGRHGRWHQRQPSSFERTPGKGLSAIVLRDSRTTIDVCAMTREGRGSHHRFRATFFFRVRFLPGLTAGRRLAGGLDVFLGGFGAIGVSPFQALMPAHLTAMEPTAFAAIVSAIPDSHAIRS